MSGAHLWHLVEHHLDLGLGQTLIQRGYHHSLPVDPKGIFLSVRSSRSSVSWHSRVALFCYSFMSLVWSHFLYHMKGLNQTASTAVPGPIALERGIGVTFCWGGITLSGCHSKNAILKYKKVRRAPWGTVFTSGSVGIEGGIPWLVPDWVMAPDRAVRHNHSPLLLEEEDWGDYTSFPTLCSSSSCSMHFVYETLPTLKTGGHHGLLGDREDRNNLHP